MESSFQELKVRLTSAPVLTFLLGLEGFMVFMDASKQGLVVVLMEDEKVVAYASYQLKKHEANYPTHDFKKIAMINRPGKLLLYEKSEYH